MNQEILERLVIDRCSGELSTDATALLDDYLDRNPAAKSSAAEIAETLRLARRALPVTAGISLPRPKLARLAAMAACFAAGLGIGLLVLHRPPISATVSQSDFWSASRFHAFAVKAGPPSAVLRWTSPVKQPQIQL